MGLCRLLIAAAVVAALIAAPAAARDRISRVVEVRILLTGNVHSDYGPEPPPENTAIGPYGTYAASWSWTQVRTTTYRRQPKRRGGGEYADRTVVESTSTLNETSNIVYRSGRAPGTPACRDPSVREPHTVSKREVHDNEGADPPRRDRRFHVVAQVQPTSCGGADDGAGGAFPGLGLESICVWTCTLPAGRRTYSVTVPDTKGSGLGEHVHGGAFTVSVIVSRSAAGAKEVRHRWQPDF